MTERNDDIKQLFSHLGLNAGVYQEMRVPPRVVAPAENTSQGSPNSKSGATINRGESGATRTYTRTPASIRPLPSMPPPAMPARPVPSAVERSPLSSFFEAVKEPISSPAVVAAPASAVDSKTEANRAVTDRMIQDIKDISRRISRDMVSPGRSRWADLPEISKPVDRSPAVLNVAPKSPPPPGAIAVPEKAAAEPVEPSKLKLKFGHKADSANIGSSENSLKSIFDRLADADND